MGKDILDFGIGDAGKGELDIVGGKLVGKVNVEKGPFSGELDLGLDLLKIVDLIDEKITLPGDIDRGVFAIIKAGIMAIG